MDVREEKQDRGVKLYPLRSKILIVLSILFAVGFFFVTDFQNGLVGLSVVLIVVGITTTEAWNRELKVDEYAPLTQLYSGYLTVLFLIVSVVPSLSVVYSLRIAIPLTLIVAFIYGLLIQYIAFRGVERDEYETAVHGYNGISVVYLTEGSYISHVESESERKFSESDTGGGDDNVEENTEE